MRRFASLAILTCVLGSGPLHAAERGRIRAINVALQPVLTVLSAALQGHLTNKADWTRCLTAGAAAGYIFYDAKARAGRGSVAPAWLEAHAAASLSANAAAGRSPLSRLRLTLGPFRADVTTPFEKNPDAAVHVGVSFAEFGALTKMQQHRNGHLVFRDGRLAFRTTKCYEADNRCFPGYTVGVFSGTIYGATSDTWPHESVHAIQALQADSVEPPSCAYFRSCSAPPQGWKQVRFDGIDLGILLAAGGYAVNRSPYERRPTEIEAWRLAEDMPPRP